MKTDESLLGNKSERNMLIRREFYVMLAAGILISVMIAFSTAGILTYPFYIRLAFSVIGISAINLMAFSIKIIK